MAGFVFFAVMFFMFAMAGLCLLALEYGVGRMGSKAGGHLAFVSVY